MFNKKLVQANGKGTVVPVHILQSYCGSGLDISN